MITALGPLRSIDDAQAPAALRSGLAAGRADGPSAEALARMAARLGVAVPVASGATQAIAASTAGAIAMWSRRALVPCLALLCALGGWSLHSAFAPTREVVQAPRALPLLQPATPRPAAPPQVAQPQPEPPQPLLPARAPAVHASKHIAMPAAAVPDPNAELTLLARAQAQLTPAPRRALALAEEHAQRYPHGVFQEERELIAIIALLNRGDLRSASARAERFERVFPSSVHTARLQSLLADHKNGASDAPTGQSAASRRTGEN